MPDLENMRYKTRVLTYDITTLTIDRQLVLEPNAHKSTTNQDAHFICNCAHGNMTHHFYAGNCRQVAATCMQATISTNVFISANAEKLCTQ